MSKWRLFLAVVLVGLAADQATKYLAVSRLTTVFRTTDMSLGEKVRAFYTWRHLERYAAEPYVVYEPLWRMRYAENQGAAWGLFRTMGDGARLAFFGAVVLGAVAFVIWSYRKLERGQRWLQVALAFIFTGAIGNYLDRLARGYVVDFIDWYWWKRPDLYWPTFNIADSLIVVGVLMVLVAPAPKAGPAPLE